MLDLKDDDFETRSADLDEILEDTLRPSLSFQDKIPNRHRV
jgi:hypothetical protein